MHQTYTYLALGDSYTIGESVSLQDNFPYQTVQFLRKKGYSFNAPEIIAETGWSTDELELGLKKCNLLSKYDFITLSIGVNNQFRGRSVEEYKMEFENILKYSIDLSADRTHVLVISIPDYGFTPFGQTLNSDKISKEIEVFNTVCKVLSIQYKVNYIDITSESRNCINDTTLVAKDKLHPSAKEYRKWAEKIVDTILEKLK